MHMQLSVATHFNIFFNPSKMTVLLLIRLLAGSQELSPLSVL